MIETASSHEPTTDMQGDDADAVATPRPRRRAPVAKPRAPRTTRTLSAAREAFVATIARDTPGVDGTRLVRVLDALIGWSVARGARIAFRGEDARDDVMAFELVDTRAVFWSAAAARGASPTLEIIPRAGLSGRAEERARVLETLNLHSRAALVSGDRLRIGFGALKNDGAREAVLALMAELLESEREA